MRLEACREYFSMITNRLLLASTSSWRLFLLRGAKNKKETIKNKQVAFLRFWWRDQKSFQESFAAE